MIHMHRQISKFKSQLFTKTMATKINKIRSINPKPDVIYSFDNIQTYKHHAKKKFFDGDRKNIKIKQQATKNSFEKYSKDAYSMVVNNNHDDIDNDTNIDVEQQLEDQKLDNLYQQGQKQQYQRKYDRIYSKELYWIQKETNQLQLIEYKNQYLKLQDIQIQDQKVQELVQKLRQYRIDKQDSNNIEFKRNEVFMDVDSATDGLLKELSDVAGSINIQYLPVLTKQIGYDIQLKCDVHDIYSKLNERVFEYMHTYDLKQLGMIKLGMSGVYPNMANQYCQKAMFDLLNEALTSGTKISLDEMLFTQFAFRNDVSHKLHDTIYSLILDQNYRQQVVDSKDLKTAVNILYSYFNNRVRKGNRRLYRNPKEEEHEQSQLVEMYLPMIQEHSGLLDVESSLKLMTILQIQQNKHLDIVDQIQLNLLENGLDGLSDIELSLLIKTLHGQNANRMVYATDSFMDMLQEQSMKRIDSLTEMDKVRLLYYFSQLQTSKHQFQIVEVLMDYVKQNIGNMEHGELHLVAYSLLFNQVEDRDIWAAYNKRVSSLEQVVPIVYYNSFKLAQLFMNVQFPFWSMGPFEASIQESERYYDIGRLTKFYQEDYQYYQFSNMLKHDFNVNIQNFVDFKNCFIIDYLIDEQQIAIFIIKESQKLSDGSLNQMHQVKTRLLERHGYQVMNCDFYEYINLSYQERKDKFAADLQKSIDANQENIKVKKEKQWFEIYRKMYEKTKYYGNNSQDEDDFGEDQQWYDKQISIMDKQDKD